MAAPLQTLLEVQSLDTQLDQLRRRRETLPERAALAAVEARRAALAAAQATTAARAHELERTQKRLEDEVATLEDKAAGTDRQLYSGTVTAPRELQALQDEAGSIRRRIGLLEDQLLVVMEELEPVSVEVGEQGAARATADEEAGALGAAVAAAESSIDGEVARAAAARTALAAEVPPALLAQYERIRQRAGGVGIARLDGHRCTGCHLEVPNREVDQLRRAPADEVVLHEECGRILVRD
jgi:predicted  nucleic acid-binding Zn-ribbon protein